MSGAGFRCIRGKTREFVEPRELLQPGYPVPHARSALARRGGTPFGAGSSSPPRQVGPARRTRFRHGRRLPRACARERGQARDRAPRAARRDGERRSDRALHVCSRRARGAHEPRRARSGRRPIVVDAARASDGPPVRASLGTTVEEEEKMTHRADEIPRSTRRRALRRSLGSVRFDRLVAIGADW